MAQVLNFACMVTQHGGDATRCVQGIEDWRDEKGLPFELGMTPGSGRRMELHGLVSIARRVSCDVWYTNLVCGECSGVVSRPIEKAYFVTNTWCR